MSVVKTKAKKKKLLIKKEAPKEKKATLETSKKPAKQVSQLRHNLVTGEWVVVATGRGKRPGSFSAIEQGESSDDVEQGECLFCDPVASGQEKDVLIYKTEDDDWTLRVFPNKFPAFSRPKGGKISHEEEGPYFRMDGVGYHEVIVTKDHDRHVGKMEPIMVAELLDAYQTRYLDLMNKKSVRYIEIFHNHGKKAGASIKHPHSQLIAVPVISPFTAQELLGAENYHHANKKCVFCTMIEWELDFGKRLVFENELFLVYCPFESKMAFEMKIIPKKHMPYFERMSDEDKIAAGEALHEAIRKLTTIIEGVSFNFYIDTAPCDGKDYPHYHWHIEVMPRTAIWAGFELSSGTEITAIEPEVAAEFLRKA